MAIAPETLLRARDAQRVRQMLTRLAVPHWMAQPLAWVWATADGRPQGFAKIAAHDPGLVNLLWLAMDLEKPPRRYDLNQNSLCTTLLMHGRSARLAGEPLSDVAGIVTLRDFVCMLPTELASGHPVERTYPLLRILAQRRLAHADT